MMMMMLMRLPAYMYWALVLLGLATAAIGTERTFENTSSSQTVRQRSSREDGGKTGDNMMPMSDEGRLMRYLNKRYKRVGTQVRPVLNSTQAVRVHFILGLMQIMDLDETKQVLSSSVYEKYMWMDEILRWDPDDFGGVTDILIPAELMWTPDIVLINNAAEQVEKTHGRLISVYHTGEVHWNSPAICRSSCELDMREFPFDEQTCRFAFGSWAYDTKKVDLWVYGKHRVVHLESYEQSAEWELMTTAAIRHEYAEELTPDKRFPILVFSITIKRRTSFYMFVLILPSLILSCMTLPLFWIPPQRPDRVSLGMGLFSSFFLMLLILVQSSPPTSDSISILGVYYGINMVIIALSTTVSALVINMAHYLQRWRIPWIVHLIFIRGFAFILCAHGASNSRDFSITDEESAMFNGVNGKERMRKLLEWRVLASLIDRILFVLYAIALSLTITGRL